MKQNLSPSTPTPVLPTRGECAVGQPRHAWARRPGCPGGWEGGTAVNGPPGGGSEPYLRPLPWRVIRAGPQPSGRRSPPPAGGRGHFPPPPRRRGSPPALLTSNDPQEPPAREGAPRPPQPWGRTRRPAAPHPPTPPVCAPSPGQPPPAEGPRPAAAPDTGPGTNVAWEPAGWK